MIVSSRFWPSNPGAMSATSSGAARHADEHQNRRNEREQRRDRPCHARGLFPFLPRNKSRIDRNERGRQCAFAEEVLQKIRDPESGHERVGRIGQPEVLSEEALPDEAREAAAENPERDERGMAVQGLYASPQRRRDAKNLFKASLRRRSGRRVLNYER